MVERDNGVDILRGFAIFTMVAANMAAHSLIEPHPLFFRIIGSIAAPMFIFLSGMMVSHTATLKNPKFGYYIKRTLATLLIAALIDVFLWDIFPFITFDVLYLIALGIPTVYFFNKLNTVWKLCLISIIFSATPLFQYYLGYSESPMEFSITNFENIYLIKESPIWRNFLHEGWFPIFPWLAVSVFGAYISSYKQKVAPEKFNKNILTAGIIMMILGISIWAFINPDLTNESFDGSSKSNLFYNSLISRQGYSELFYPPTLFYLLSFIGFILILLVLIPKFQHFGIIKLFSVYGRSSLLVYILHTIFIVFIFNKINSYPFSYFLGLFFIHVFFLWVICYSIQKFKNGKHYSFWINFIFGH